VPAATATRVAILADDLIWATRLGDAVTAAGGVPIRVRTLPALSETAAPFVVVDLTARAYDGVEAVRAAAGAGARVLAVGQHDDVGLRKAALAAGAEKVLAYRKLFEDGPAVFGAWLATAR
jgi:hypothetical protein